MKISLGLRQGAPFEPTTLPCSHSERPVRTIETLQLNGQERSYVTVKFPMADKRGNRFVGGVSVDISDSIRDREMLRRQSALLDLSSNAILMIDMDGKITYWNRGAERLYGWSAAEVTGRDSYEVLKGDFAGPYEQVWEQYLREGYWEGEIPVRTRLGEPITVLSQWTLLRDATGKPIAGMGISTDVTEKKIAFEEMRRAEAEAAARAAELTAVLDAIPAASFMAHDATQKLERILSSISDGLAVLDRNWYCSYINAQGASVFGMTPDQFTGRCIWEIFPSFDDTRIRSEFERVFESDGPVHFQEFFSEPANKWIEGHCYSSDDQLSVYFRDITERKRNENALRVSESRFRRLFESGMMGIGIPDRFGGFSEGNDELLRLTGYSRQDLEEGRLRWDIMTPPEYNELDAIHIVEAAERGSCTPYEKEYIRKDGTRVPILCGYALLDGTQDQYVGFVQDLSLQKEAESALREREQRFRVLAESLPQLVWIRDADGHYIYANQRLYTYLGTSAELLRTNAFEFIHPGDLSETVVRWKRCTETGEDYINEYRLRRHDGEYRHFLARAVAVRDENGQILQWLGSATDIHDQKIAEDALRRSEKLNTAARFAASMGHEINNPLNAVMNSLYLALQDQTLNPETKERLMMADRELARTVHVVRQALRFNRQSTSPMLLDLSEIMDSVVALYKVRLRPELTELETEYRTHEKFLCFGDEIRQVFGNLVSNALNSMKRGGRLRIRVALGRSWNQSSTRGIRVTIADTGTGIPFNLRNEIFEPFVASKESTGTGLGLWVTADIVKKHSGTVQFRSSTDPERHGTAFSVFLPLTREA